MHLKGTIVVSIGKPQGHDHNKMDLKNKHSACHDMATVVSSFQS